MTPSNRVRHNKPLAVRRRAFSSAIDFISYRRDDEKYFAGRLYERLLRHFSRQQIFMDVDSIPLGLDFTKVVEDRLAQSGVMLVVIGKNWLNRSAHYPVGTASTCHTKTSAPTPRASFTPWKAH